MGQILLRSYRVGDWPDWFRAAGLTPPRLTGPVFDSAALMVEAARRGHGVALAPARLFAGALAAAAVTAPFPIESGQDAYWLTRLKSRPPSRAMTILRDWLQSQAAIG